MSICDRFPTLTPLSIRRERMIDIFKIVKKMNVYAKHSEKREEKKQKPKVIRRPAGDTWF